MAYLGRSLSNGNYLKLDDISSQFNSSTSAFNLTAGGQAFYPTSSYSLLVVISGVVQEADTAYQVLNNQIIFASPPDSSDTFYALVLGIALGVGVPANGTITGDKFAKPFSYDNGLLYLDDTNNFVGINKTTPEVSLDVVGDVSVSGVITATSFSGNATSALSATYAISAGVATFAQNLTGTPNITVGVITASSLEVSGNVSIAGTLTYEDVTNIDSLGIVTARTGIQVLAGGINAVGAVTATSFSGPLTGNVTGNVTGNLTGEVNAASFDTNVAGVVVTGVATATSFSGSGSGLTNVPYTSLTGVTTDIVGDTTPQLGGNLDINNKTIQGTGSVNITGVITATSFDGSLALSDVTGLGANVSTFLATPSSSNLAAAVTGETGSGALVFATSPTLVTPSLGAASATSINASGIVTASGGFNLGISSAGSTITSGPVTTLNFIGAGNTFALNGTTVDISIAGGGGGAAGLATATGTDGVTIVGVGTTVVAGAGNSEGVLQAFGNIAITDGVLITDQNIDRNIFIPSGKNGLLIGPVTVGVGLTVDVASGSVLVVV